MKRLLLIFIICAPYHATLWAEEMPGKFYINKVNRVEKLWVLSPDRRNFIGNRGLQKFDYGRQILDLKNIGENYVVTFSYSGPKLNRPLILRFEYSLSLNQKKPYIKKYFYNNLKTGVYAWTLKNLGERYKKEGKVTRWKVSFIYDRKVIVKKRSFTWHAMEGT